MTTRWTKIPRVIKRSEMNLYDWIFRFNPYDNKWYATKRENYNELFSNNKSGDVLSSSEINTLVEIIKKTNGNSAKISKLLS
jgi:hypothetical protein